MAGGLFVRFDRPAEADVAQMVGTAGRSACSGQDGRLDVGLIIPCGELRWSPSGAASLVDRRPGFAARDQLDRNLEADRRLQAGGIVVHSELFGFAAPMG